MPRARLAVAPWVVLSVLFVLCAAGVARAQYNAGAGDNAPRPSAATVEYRADDGTLRTREVARPIARDSYGNAQGNQHDLAVDGAFEGQTVAVIQLYTGEGFDFTLPRAALKEKGFSVYRWSNQPPTPGELKAALGKACQLWIISGEHQLLDREHLKVIKEFWDSGRGVYIWGDNDPYYADANFVAEGLFGTQMLGNVMGDRSVPVQREAGKAGVLRHHLITTGIEFLYEGITIATIQPNQVLSPLIYGSADNLVAAFYDRNGKRAILDGGFTRLYLKWDTAGTARYVKNAAAWLVNYERFGDHVVGAAVKKKTASK